MHLFSSSIQTNFFYLDSNNVISGKKVIIKRLALAVADGIMSVDGKNIYTAKDLKVGLFKSEK